MFFKKRREAKKAAAAEVRQNIIDEFQGRFDEANKSPDLSERILKFQDIANDVEAVLDELSGTAKKDAEKKRKIFVWTATPTAIVASAVYPPALIGLAGMAASVYGGKKLGKKVGEMAERKNLEKEKVFIDALKGQQAQALDAQDELVSTNAPGVAASKGFEEVLSRVPRLREKFAAAYGKKIVEENGQKPTPANRRPDGPGPRF
ncbi:MAG: hypothetical protein ACAH83_15350 [Alphaproteobacteria bacterium]